MMQSFHEPLRYATFFAPRGSNRMLALGHQIAQRYLVPTDQLIGIIGDAGSGKSLLIKGMFPGLELTNDDDGINQRPAPLIRDAQRHRFSAHTYHLDVRFELAFIQRYELVEAIKGALKDGHRVVLEHFDSIYHELGINGELLVAIGEEVIVVRPNLFGPEPDDLKGTVYKSLRYRRMAHSAEDLLVHVLESDYGVVCDGHGDVKHGFILSFNVKPDIPVKELEAKVNALIATDAEITYKDATHISIGSTIIQHCTGPRIHVRHTHEIRNFRLLDDYVYDPAKKTYELVGMVTEETIHDIHRINHFGE
jgi:hypothetical protein